MDENRLLLQYNLQFFANDDATEEPTAKKLDDARKKGQVAKSQELGNAASLLALFVILRIAVGFMNSGFQNMFRFAWNRIPDLMLNAAMEGGYSSQTIRGMFLYTLGRMLILMAPFLIVGVLIAFVINILQIGFKVTTEPMKPKFDKMNPVNGVKRLFSKEALVRLLLSIAKILLIGVIAYTTIKDHSGELLVIYDIDLLSSVMLIGDIVLSAGIKISAVFLVLGFVDLLYQKRKFHKDMMMTKQEVKDEYKNTEGDPQIKGQQRQRMREASQRRMMQEVPQADVVITNPTHLAVALRYDTERASAPVVVAKGEEYLAGKIKEAAREAGVQIIENKPLARMLYQTVDVGQEIPPELYQAVAEVLALVYNLNKAG